MIDPVFDRRLSRKRRWKYLLWFVARIFVMPAMFLTLRLRAHGIKNMPRSGGVIVIANHVNFFDPILFVAASARPVLWMAKAEVFDYPVLKWWAIHSGAFPVDRGKPDRSALRHAETLLDDGMVVGMFPEGTRSRSGGLQQPFSGVSLLAVRSGAPIVPSAIVGSEALPFRGFPTHRKGRYPKIDILFGEAFTLDTHKPDGSRWKLEELTDAMMLEIARLLPEAYRGIYAGRAECRHPAVRPWTGTGPR